RADAVPIRMPGRRAGAPHSASRGSSLATYAPTASPAVSVDVMSLAEWTATSIRPASSASSISLTNTPREPISPNGFVRSLSPTVVIGTIAISTPGRRNRSAARSVWISASRDPRVPRRTSTSPLLLAEPEEVPHRVGVDGAVRPGRGLLHPDRRQVQQLVDDLRRERLDRETIALGQASERPAGARELGRANLLRARPQRGDLRHDPTRREPGAEALGLVGDDRLGARGLLPAAGEAYGDYRLEVVDVV